MSGETIDNLVLIIVILILAIGLIVGIIDRDAHGDVIYPMSCVRVERDINKCTDEKAECYVMNGNISCIPRRFSE